MTVTKELVLSGSSTESWEDAALEAIDRAEASVKHIHTAEVTRQEVDLTIGREPRYRTKVRIEFAVEEPGESERYS